MPVKKPKLKKVEATWICELHTYCPGCRILIDLIDYFCDMEKGSKEIHCDECGEAFIAEAQIEG